MAPATVRRAPYKDFLQPALHRRFSTTASILLGIAYIQSIFLASWNSLFWSWFPVGPAGIRTLFLFFCGVTIIVLRIAQYHVGLRTSNSGFQTFVQNVFKTQTLEAIASYTVSATLFGLTYLFSASEGATFSWITYYSGDRARLNEKPLFLLLHFGIFGAVQALIHLFRDNDRLSLGVVSRDGKASEQNGDPANQLKRFIERLPYLLMAAGTQSLLMPFVSFVIYMLFLRSTAWQTTLLFLRPFYNLPKTNLLPLTWPFTAPLILRCIFASFMLSFAWMVGNTAFSIFLVKEPLKNGQPLTKESKDPNGSLLNGLKSKKLSIKCFAMWELAFIARDFEPRRKAIYEDIDRKDGPTWSQVYAICLDVVKGMETRVEPYLTKPEPTPTTPEKREEEKKKKTQVKDDPIFVSTPPRRSFRTEVEKAVGQVARSPDQKLLLSSVAQKAVEAAKDTHLSLLKSTGYGDTSSLLREVVQRVLETPLGIPFRQEYSRRVTSTVLGTPYGEPSLYINAINALSLLSVHSLSEDKFGNVQRDVASIIRTFSSAVRKLETFKAQLPPHWTDVKRRRNCPEVDEVLAALRDSLAQLIQEFGPYSRDLRLTLMDMRLAREAAGVSAEVRQVS